MKIIGYNEYNINETILSSISTFLKTNYNKIFPNATQSLNNLFNSFSKKVDTDKNISNLYQRFVKANQTMLVNEINIAESIEAVDKLIIEEVKYFYFTLKPIVNKLQNDEFTIEKIFERSRDKRLMILMSYPEDKFSNAVSEYVTTIAIPAIKKDSGIEIPTTERVQFIILEAVQEENLIKYKKSAIKWFNLSLFELLKTKMQILNKIGANAITGNAVDQISKQMKGSNNINAKKMILNNIINMDRQELQNLANMLGLKTDELGKL